MADFAFYISEGDEYTVSKLPVISMVHFNINELDDGECDGTIGFKNIEAMKELHEALGAAIVLITKNGEKEALYSTPVP